ncbi:MAG: hypothetical protein ACE5ES_05990 [Candidatus Nanoarchaeia archaeon]
MQWIKVNVESIQTPSYVDIDKSYKINIVQVNGKYRVRAYFLVTSNVYSEKNQFYPIYADIVELNKERDAEQYIEGLFGSFLQGRKK